MKTPVTIRVFTADKKELYRKQGLPHGFYKELVFGQSFFYELPQGTIVVQEIRGTDYVVSQVNFANNEPVVCFVEAEEGVVLMLLPLETNDDELVTEKTSYPLLLKMYRFFYMPPGTYPLHVSGPASYYLLIQPPPTFLEGLQGEVHAMGELRKYLLQQQRQFYCLPTVPVLKDHLPSVRKAGKHTNKHRIKDLQIRSFILEVLDDYSHTVKQEPQSQLVYMSLQQRAFLVKQYLLENIADTALYDLEEIAKRFFAEPRTITRAFQRHTGKTIKQFIVDKRIELALKYLHETTMPIYEIALRCGFKDASYFIHKYRAKYGKTPGADRKGS